MSRLIIFLLIALAAVVVAHPTYYPHVELKRSADTAYPPILSWHAHILYMESNNEQYQSAIDLRALFVQEFSDYLGEDCDGDYDFGRLCMIIDHDMTNKTVFPSPFPVGEFAVFVPIPYYSLVIPWFVQNRGEFSLLVHPNSGWGYNDHTEWASWTGSQWPLDLSFFTEGKQTSEIDRHRGDAGNPECVGVGAVCGDISTNVTVLCCSGTTCSSSQEKFSSPLQAVELYRCN